MMTGKSVYGLNLSLIFRLTFMAATNCAAAEKIRLALPLRVIK